MAPDEPRAGPRPAPAAGLCADCRWARRVTSGRGATFLLCRRSEADARYAKYPVLPRRECAGYEAESAGG